MQLRFTCLALLVACTPDTSAVSVRLAPEVISSIDGTLGVTALVLADRQPSSGETVDIAVTYTDRNGTPHDVAPATGETDKTGQFAATLTGLTWDGTGTVTATVQGTDITGTATFAVLDRTPPKVTINPPTASSIRAGQDVTAEVHITDEIGVSQVYFEWAGQFGNQFGRERATVVGSGSVDTTVKFDIAVPDNVPVGTMITLYALAADLSGNEGAAQPVTVVTVP
jgi:hypothetical protein